MSVYGSLRDIERVAPLDIFVADFQEVLDINIRAEDIDRRCAVLPHFHHLISRSAGGIGSGRSLLQPAVHRHGQVIFLPPLLGDIVAVRSCVINTEDLLRAPAEDLFPGPRRCAVLHVEPELLVHFFGVGAQIIDQSLRCRACEQRIRLIRVLARRTHDTGLVLHLHADNGICLSVDLLQVLHQFRKCPRVRFPGRLTHI